MEPNPELMATMSRMLPPERRAVKARPVRVKHRAQGAKSSGQQPIKVRPTNIPIVEERTAKPLKVKLAEFIREAHAQAD